MAIRATAESGKTIKKEKLEMAKKTKKLKKSKKLASTKTLMDQASPKLWKGC